MILAGDVGGTKTVLGLFERSESGLREVHSRSFPSRDYPSLEAILGEFLTEAPGSSPEAACFGVAGPVQDGKARTTNLPWHLEAASLARATKAPRVTLINDLQAEAYGLLWLAPEELETLHPGTDGPKKNAGVIAPGTGLGEALLYWDGQRYHAIASEGGHADLAARNEQEIALLRHLANELGPHVSYERVLSGDGIHRIYAFLRDSGHSPEPQWLRERLAGGDPNATITQLGLAAEHPLCVDALELFCSILAAEAGNLALRYMATSGIFLGGGIVPKILPALEKEAFIRAFTDKGRFTEWMTTIPVRVALNSRAPLLGAAHFPLHDLA